MIGAVSIVGKPVLRPVPGVKTSKDHHFEPVVETEVKVDVVH